MAGIDKLQQSLINAKRFMNHDALNKNTNTSSNTGGRIREPQIREPQFSMPAVPQPQLNESSIPTPPTVPQMSMNPKSKLTTEAINNSRLPQAIKEAMIKNPIPDPVPSGTLSHDFMSEVSKKMNSPEYSLSQMRSTANSTIQSEDHPIPPPIPVNGLSGDINQLKPLIKECLTEILEEKNLLIEQKDISENLQLRVGNKIFTGNIKSVKTIKK
jgi:hypothetical protein